MLKRLFGRFRKQEEHERAPQAARRKEVRSDIPAEELREPTPHFQSGRGPFDPRGEREIDREQRESVVNRNEQFSDEDWLTNRTNDPRIGTHGRKYE